MSCRIVQKGGESLQNLLVCNDFMMQKNIIPLYKYVYGYVPESQIDIDNKYNILVGLRECFLEHI